MSKMAALRCAALYAYLFTSSKIHNENMIIHTNAKLTQIELTASLLSYVLVKISPADIACRTDPRAAWRRRSGRRPAFGHERRCR